MSLLRGKYRAPIPTAGGAGAEERARELLRTLLTPAETILLDDTGQVQVVGPVSGRTWTLHGYGVRLEPASPTDYRGRFPMTSRGTGCCIHVAGSQRDALRPGDVNRLGSTDDIIVQLLAIKTNERAFVWAIPGLSIAAKTELVGERPRRWGRHLVHPRFLPG